MKSITSLIIRKELRERRTSLIIYCLVGVLSVWLYVSMFPSLQSQAEQLTKALESMPKELLRAFGAEGTGLENVESLLATKQFGLILPVLLIILMLNRAANMLAGEIEQGTIGTLLSQPISRSRLYWAKYSSAVIALVLFIIASILVCIPIISAYHLPYSLPYILVFAGVSTLFGLAVLGISMLTSALVSERSKVYSAIGGGVMLMFILNIIAGLKPALDNLKYGSVFYYFSANDILVRHHVNLVSIGLFSLCALAGALTGAWLFSKRDISA